MPSSGMALLDDLVIELTSDWLEFCNRIDHHLLQCVSQNCSASAEHNTHVC
jgi:hypothetical protein